MNSGIPCRMAAVQLVGHGGIDKLVYRTDVPVPVPDAGEVLIKVAAAGVNNTDINTRIGWYSKAVDAATESGGMTGIDNADATDATWSGIAMAFPRVQGADCCGTIVAVGDRVDPARIGERVIVNPLQPSIGGNAPQVWRTFGSECDGAFAQYAKAPSRHAWRVACDWSDAELASIPCAWSTAENMLCRGLVGAERVLITGASGAVGSAAVQLARCRGAQVTAMAESAKGPQVRAAGAESVIGRHADPVEVCGSGAFDVVLDLVGGKGWPRLLEALKPGGRYVSAGAIAGPLVELDLRTLYLNDLTLLGCTRQDDAVFENLVARIERGDIRPVVANAYPLFEIGRAQEAFLGKAFFGKLVLIP